MNWINFLVAFLVFVAIVAVMFYGEKWLAREAGFPAEIQRIILIVLGVAALIVFLLRFVAPLARVGP